MTLRQKIIVAIGCIIGLITLGTIGYMKIEGWNFLDSLYMVVITLTSVGFSEVKPLSTAGRIFTIALILTGLGTLMYAVSTIVALLLEGEFIELLYERRVKRMIEKLQGHYIVCGYSDVAKYVVEELQRAGADFVIIVRGEERYELLKQRRLLVIRGIPFEEEVLISAGITRARGLFSLMHTDQDNLIVVITARSLNPSLRIVTCAFSDESVSKLEKAGADSVISVNALSGARIAAEMMRPAVVSFLDSLLIEKEKHLRIEEVEIMEGSRLIGQTLREARIPQKTGLIVIAIKDAEGRFKYNPGPDVKLNLGDKIIVIGDIERVRKLKEIAHSEV